MRRRRRLLHAECSDIKKIREFEMRKTRQVLNTSASAID
jgi:hypothetical protein